jgi:hypothetical protein
MFSIISIQTLTLFYTVKNFNLLMFTLFLNNRHLKKIESNYLITYKFFFFIKTKHLFLFTIYLLYTKLLKLFTLFTFNFSISKKKIKKIIILRAPCYHKNSKEQYGYSVYKGKIKSTFLYNKNKYYNFYFLTFLLSNKIKFLSKYIYLLQKNEKKYSK